MDKFCMPTPCKKSNILSQELDVIKGVHSKLSRTISAVPKN